MKLNLVNILKEIFDDSEFLRLRGIYMLPVDYLWNYKEFDRESINKINSDEYINNLQKDIKENGFKSPLVLQIGKYNNSKNYYKFGLLIEGNHRLFIAKKLNIKEVPVKLLYRDFNEDSIKKAKPIDTDSWDKRDYLSPNEVIKSTEEKINYLRSLRK